MWAWLFSYKNEFTCAQWQPIWQLLPSQGPFYTTFHLLLALHHPWSCCGAGSDFPWSLCSWALQCWTESTEVTRDSWESAGRGTTCSCLRGGQKSCDSTERQGPAQWRDLEEEKGDRNSGTEHRSFEHFSPNQDGSAGIQHASDEVVW